MLLLRLPQRLPCKSCCTRGLCTRIGGDEKKEVAGRAEEGFLPANRPWERTKPDSEILKPVPDFWQTRNEFEPRVSDDPDQYPNIMPYVRRKFRYPQFFLQGRQDGGTFVDTWKQEIKQFKETDSSIFQLPHHMDIFPDQYDIVIIGGGVIGTSIALQIRTRIRELVSILVVEKDPTYSKATSTTAIGGITQQFMLPENLQMAHYGADFIRNAKLHLSILDQEPPDLHFTPTGYLYLADTQNQADTILENHERQTDYGSYVDVLNPHQMETRFPWLNTEDVLIGAHGVQNEGFIDPVAYLIALKGKAEFLGTRFMHAEFVDFNLELELNNGIYDADGYSCEKVRFVVVRLPDGRERQIRCAYVFIAAGHESRDITEKLNIGLPESRGLRTIPLPVEKRKRYIYVFNCPDGPGLDFPFLVDGTGVWCRREGLGGNFVSGKFMTQDEEPDPSNLDVDYSFFEHKIWPVLARRVQAFKRLKIVSAWATYDDYNYFDQNPVIGKHPYYFNMLWACGFSGTGIQMGPAVGRGVAELLNTGWLSYETIDLGRFGWSRILNGKPLKERKIVPADMTQRIEGTRGSDGREVIE